MRLFEESLVSRLQAALIGKHIDSIELSTHGLGVLIADIQINCSETSEANIAGSDYTFVEAPVTGPWGLLLRQMVKDVSLDSPSVLRIQLHSGDSLAISTIEGLYESVQFSYPNDGDKFVMDIY